MTAHTPGPWHVKQIPDGAVVDFEIHDARDVPVALAYEMYGAPEGEADAALIAAAPELLEVLETYQRALASFAKAVQLDITLDVGRPGEKKAAQGIQDVIDRGRAVIAKATGQPVQS